VRHASWAAPELVGLVEFTGWIGGGRMRRPHWRGLLTPAEVQESGWARPPDQEPEPPATEPAAPRRPPPTPPVVHPSAADSRGSDSAGSDLAGAEPAGHVQPRRLEQHFVYNSLNTIAALIRTDPARARELLFGFADLSRAADRPGESTLARELDAVRGYLQLEQARFGPRLQVAVDVESGLELVPVGAMEVLDVVRRAVQQGIEPLLGGGLLVVVARRTGEGCAVTVSASGRQPTTLLLPAGPV
jgi:hypothetical protein